MIKETRRRDATATAVANEFNIISNSNDDDRPTYCTALLFCSVRERGTQLNRTCSRSTDVTTARARAGDAELIG